MNPSHRQNNFDFMRCLGAAFVVYGHTAVLLGAPEKSLRLWGKPIETAGVLIFFSISGYLVTESWQRDPRLLPFFLKRFLRLFPALIVCVSLSACLLGPCVTLLNLRSYFSDYYFLDYFNNLLLLPRFHLPGVFFGNIYKVAVNGSLWTLPVEFFCYMSVAALALGRRRLRLDLALIAAALVYVCHVYLANFYRGHPIIVLDTSVSAALELMPFFFVGSVLCLAKNRIRFQPSVAVGLLFWMFVTEDLDWSPAIAVPWLALPYITLTFGLSNTPVLLRWGRYGDFSYGIYLYAFPIQQLLIYLFRNTIAFSTLFILTSLSSVVLAWCSWRLVEGPALGLKPARKEVILVGKTALPVDREHAPPGYRHPQNPVVTAELSNSA